MKSVLICLLLILHPWGNRGGISFYENNIISNSLDILSELTKELGSLDESNEYQNLNKIISKIDLLCTDIISDSVHQDINEIINMTEETQHLDQVFPSLTLRLKLFYPEIVINEFRFRTLVAVQHQLNVLNKNLPDLDRLISSAEFGTFNNELGRIKTSLVNRQMQILSLTDVKEEKFRCWLAIKRMLNEIDISKSETGDQIIQRSPFGLVIRPGILLNRLTELNKSESNREVKEYAGRILMEIENVPSKYRAVNDTIIYEYKPEEKPGVKKTNMEALEFFNRAFICDDNDERIFLYGKAIQNDSDFTAAYYNRGICFYMMENYEDAVKDFIKVLQLDSTYSSACTNLGLSYFKLDNYEESVNKLSQALNRGEKDITIFITRGLCYQKLNNYVNAIKDYSKVIEIDSNSFTAYSNRAECYKHLKKQNEVINDYKKLIELKPDNSTLYYNLGCIYFNKREWEQAVKYWEEGLKVNPKDPNIAANLPRAKMKLENKK